MANMKEMDDYWKQQEKENQAYWFGSEHKDDSYWEQSKSHEELSFWDEDTKGLKHDHVLKKDEENCQKRHEDHKQDSVMPLKQAVYPTEKQSMPHSERVRDSFMPPYPENKIDIQTRNVTDAGKTPRDMTMDEKYLQYKLEKQRRVGNQEIKPGMQNMATQSNVQRSAQNIPQNDIQNRMPNNPYTVKPNGNHITEQKSGSADQKEKKRMTPRTLIIHNLLIIFIITNSIGYNLLGYGLFFIGILVWLNFVLFHSVKGVIEKRDRKFTYCLIFCLFNFILYFINL